MPLTVTASNSVAYHLFQLPDMSAPTPEDTCSISTLDNDLTDGYRSSVLVGFTSGTRSWKLALPTLASIDVLALPVTDINGASVSRADYLWSLYTENKVTGTPFVYADPSSGTNYFVDFADANLSFKRMRIKLFSTGVTLQQRRLPGVTI